MYDTAKHKNMFFGHHFLNIILVPRGLKLQAKMAY